MVLAKVLGLLCLVLVLLPCLWAKWNLPNRKPAYGYRQSPLVVALLMWTLLFPLPFFFSVECIEECMMHRDHPCTYIFIPYGMCHMVEGGGVVGG